MEFCQKIKILAKNITLGKIKFWQKIDFLLPILRFFANILILRQKIFYQKPDFLPETRLFTKISTFDKKNNFR